MNNAAATVPPQRFQIRSDSADGRSHIHSPGIPSGSDVNQSTATDSPEPRAIAGKFSVFSFQFSERADGFSERATLLQERLSSHNGSQKPLARTIVRAKGFVKRTSRPSSFRNCFTARQWERFRPVRDDLSQWAHPAGRSRRRRQMTAACRSLRIRLPVSA